MGNGGPGCFDPTTIDQSITHAQLFGWEVMTFTLISVYACGVAKPGHGSFTPLAVGLSLVACAGTGGMHSGAALNPARVIGEKGLGFFVAHVGRMRTRNRV
jgi:glycerol uptake facilitator-like aquaporin